MNRSALATPAGGEGEGGGAEWRRGVVWMSISWRRKEDAKSSRNSQAVATWAGYVHGTQCPTGCSDLDGAWM